jgi:hypothetical protein
MRTKRTRAHTHTCRQYTGGPTQRKHLVGAVRSQPCRLRGGAASGHVGGDGLATSPHATDSQGAHRSAHAARANKSAPFRATTHAPVTTLHEVSRLPPGNTAGAIRTWNSFGAGVSEPEVKPNRSNASRTSCSARATAVNAMACREGPGGAATTAAGAAAADAAPAPASAPAPAPAPAPAGIAASAGPLPASGTAVAGSAPRAAHAEVSADVALASRSMRATTDSGGAGTSSPVGSVASTGRSTGADSRMGTV